MNNEMEFIVASLTLGTGATLVMDLWAGLLKRVFGIPSLNYAMVGRWIGHFHVAALGMKTSDRQPRYASKSRSAGGPITP